MIILSDLDLRHHHLTPAGRDELRRQIEVLQQTRNAVVAEMRDIISQSGNSALEDSSRALHQKQVTEIDEQIALIERIISTAKTIDRPASTDHVQIGSQVTLTIGGKEQIYTLVGSIEADPSGGKLSDESPIGRQLLGKCVNDRFEVQLPSQRIAVRVVAIA